MKQIIDFNTWERKSNFEFFAGFANPCVNITCEVCCGNAREAAHRRKESFFIYYLYAIMEAVNRIEAFRYRLDNEGRIVLYDKIDVYVPVKDNTGGFTTVRVPFDYDFTRFYEAARAQIAGVSEHDPYSVENAESETDTVVVSAVPKLPFTSVTCTLKSDRGNDYPLFAVGQLTADNKLPIAACVHHGFVDGEHLAQFYERIRQTLALLPIEEDRLLHA
ncbi:MAG: chloramphenicol acetyltransferase [Prevotellaceae bacterium]|jgi:chloramphenicol O-acetyltransferase type A|nr:chloramphenicol acetyltransferase [Prevotellaceae bacterium]